jgi:hypothetical protein
MHSDGWKTMYIVPNITSPCKEIVRTYDFFDEAGASQNRSVRQSSRAMKLIVLLSEIPTSDPGSDDVDYFTTTSFQGICFLPSLSKRTLQSVQFE